MWAEEILTVYRVDEVSARVGRPPVVGWFETADFQDELDSSNLTPSVVIFRRHYPPIELSVQKRVQNDGLAPDTIGIFEFWRACVYRLLRRQRYGKAIGTSRGSNRMPLAQQQAHSTVVTFDDLPGDGYQIPNGYCGLNWNNFDCDDGADIPNSGYKNGIVTSPNVAYNAFGYVATISASPFTFNSAYFTGAWNDGLTVAITGYLSGNVVDEKSFIVNFSGPTLEVFNWADVDELSFASNGGTPHSGGGGEQFVMDNFTYNAVPEPSTRVLVGIGAVSLLAYGWRRRDDRKYEL